jgi:hypothetical protein
LQFIHLLTQLVKLFAQLLRGLSRRVRLGPGSRWEYSDTKQSKGQVDVSAVLHKGSPLLGYLAPREPINATSLRQNSRQRRSAKQNSRDAAASSNSIGCKRSLGTTTVTSHRQRRKTRGKTSSYGECRIGLT